MKREKKDTLRAAVLERRGELDEETVERDSALLCARLEAHRIYEQATGIGGYAAIRGEIDPMELLADALEAQRAVYLPRVLDEHHLEFARVHDFDDLVEGAFGVMEPQGPAASLGDIDFFLVPGVAFDRQGGRIGFGRGYYDRVLGRRRQLGADRACLVGLCYEWQVIDSTIPVEPHDVAMDFVATDNEIIECNPSRQ